MENNIVGKHSRKKLEQQEAWFQTHWRAAAGWSYLCICWFDFLVAPIFFSWFSYVTKSTIVPWVPLTIQGGGLFHVAFGAIVGITSYGRTQEKVSLNTLDAQNDVSTTIYAAAPPSQPLQTLPTKAAKVTKSAPLQAQDEEK